MFNEDAVEIEIWRNSFEQQFKRSEGCSWTYNHERIISWIHLREGHLELTRWFLVKAAEARRHTLVQEERAVAAVVRDSYIGIKFVIRQTVFLGEPPHELLIMLRVLVLLDPTGVRREVLVWYWVFRALLSFLAIDRLSLLLILSIAFLVR